jgi:hypothetical protein
MWTKDIGFDANVPDGILQIPMNYLVGLAGV